MDVSCWESASFGGRREFIVKMGLGFCPARCRYMLSPRCGYNFAETFIHKQQITLRWFFDSPPKIDETIVIGSRSNSPPDPEKDSLSPLPETNHRDGVTGNRFPIWWNISIVFSVSTEFGAIARLSFLPAVGFSLCTPRNYKITDRDSGKNRGSIPAHDK